MSYYHNSPEMCRVDFFKATGKWYCTEAISFAGVYEQTLIEDAFAIALDNHLRGQRLQEMIAVCLDPYHKHSHPQTTYGTVKEFLDRHRKAIHDFNE